MGEAKAETKPPHEDTERKSLDDDVTMRRASSAVHHAGGNRSKSDAQKKNKKRQQEYGYSVVRVSPAFMVMILAIVTGLSFSLGRFCPSFISSSGRDDSHLLLENDLQDDATVNKDSSNNNNHNEDIIAVSNGAEHLMVDVTNADPRFLRSPERLEAALSTLLQDHLHDKQLTSRLNNNLEHGGGISLTILSLESHVFLHAWPTTGVLTLDIYRSLNDDDDDDDKNDDENVSLLTLHPVVAELFAIGTKPHFYWAIKHRGLDYQTYKSDPADSADFRMHYLGCRAFTHKELVSVVETPLQTFEVYDVVDIRDADQKTDRILFLDYVSQSSRLGLEPYHEALVQPALWTHPHPKRVAIVGGGEGATLREVLKHVTVQEAVMIEIDGVMMNASRSALLEWNDCSDLVGSVGNCFDDPRATVHAADASRWFLDRYYGREAPEEEKFDVIIMDALDPSSLVKFSDVLYGNEALAQSMHNALTENGILVAQLGIADRPFNPGHHHNAESDAVMRMVQLFERVGFEYSTSYTEQHCGFHAPWSFFVFFRDEINTKTRWYTNPANVDLELSQRAVSTISGDFPFKYFDGATMMGYQYPTRAEQNVYCRTFPQAPGCRTARYLDALHRSDATTTVVPATTTTLIRNETCSTASFRQESVQSLTIDPSTAQLVSEMSSSHADTGFWRAIESGIKSHGQEHHFLGSAGYMVNAFVERTSEDDSTDSCDADFLATDESLPHLNPFIARNHHWMMASTTSTADHAVNGVDCTEVLED